MSEDNPAVKVVAVRLRHCPRGEEVVQHVEMLKLEDGGEIGETDAMYLMDAGRSYYMIPPPGAPAYAAHVATGLPLIIQTRICPDCNERVLFA